MAAPELDVRYIARLARLELSDEEVAQVPVAAFRRAQVRRGVAPGGRERRGADRAREPGVQRVPRGRGAAKFHAAEALANAPRQANDLFVVTKVLD